LTLEAYLRGDWRAVIEGHPLESHDPGEWLRYGVALLQTIQPGPDVGKQQQQAALAFVQAQKEGATAEEVAVAQRQSVLLSLGQSLLLAGLRQEGLAVLVRQLPEWVPARDSAARGLLLAGQLLVSDNLDVGLHNKGDDLFRIKKSNLEPKLDIEPQTKIRQQLLAGNHALGLDRNSSQNNSKIAITTHHKCGTAFLFKTFNLIKNRLGLKMWRKFYEFERLDGEDWDIVFEQHSRIEDLEQKVKGIHCIRRPESLIFSAALYHQKAREPWLDIPLDKFDHNTYRAFTEARPYNLINDSRIEIDRKAELVKGYKSSALIPIHFEAPYEFGGETYRNMLNKFKSIEEKLLFEMQCYSFGIISDMLAFNHADFYWIRLEEVSFDINMRELSNAFSFVGFKEDELAICLDSARTNMLGADPNAAGKHGTTGISREWKDHFTGELENKYNSIYKDASQILGYT
jgi:hypothetical protein